MGILGMPITIPEALMMKGKPIHILITDDHVLVRSALSRLIRSLFPSVLLYEASNGEEALEIIRAKTIDVVLLDVQMPVLNGVGTMRRIKELQARPHVLI